MLVGLHRLDFGLGPLVHGRQAAAVLVFGVVSAFFIHREIAGELHHLAGGAQGGFGIGCLQIDGGALNPRRLHLAGDHAFPY